MSDLVRHLESADLSRAAVMAVEVSDARSVLAETRARFGFAELSAPLLGKPDDNVKTSKGAGTWTLSLAPADASGDWNVCRYATDSCRNACVLSTAGKGRLDSVRRGRTWKTVLLAEQPQVFLRLLVAELSKLPAGTLVRLNTASDLPWEQLVPWLFEDFSELKFYDYTKWTARTELPENYRLTFSISERQSLPTAVAMATLGRSVAVVVNVKRGHELPAEIDGVPTVDGDVDDDRFHDPNGSLVLLRAKGDARSLPAGDGEFVKAV